MARGFGALTVGLLLGALVAQAQSPFVIERGRVVVDGTLSPGEWDRAHWIPMDRIYWATPVDLTNAAWAALWDPASNRLYVAVTGTDTDHVQHLYTAWDGQDAVEVYVNARNDDAFDYDSVPQPYAHAQQYVAGWDSATTSAWAILGNGTPLPPHMLPALAFSEITNRYTYEMAIVPYDELVLTNLASSTVVPLQPRRWIGLDVVMNTRQSGGGFGMWCQNQVGSKFRNAGALLDHRLLGPPGTVIDLSLVPRHGPPALAMLCR
jgi:hypothetical protein